VQFIRKIQFSAAIIRF